MNNVATMKDSCLLLERGCAWKYHNTFIEILKGLFWGLNFVLYCAYHIPQFDKYKITPEKWPENSLIRGSLAELAFNHFFVRPVGLYFLYPYFKVIEFDSINSF